MIKGQLIQMQGNASMYRKESFNGRSTALVEWVVMVGDRIMRHCTTKKDAIVWLNIYKD